ncbi:MAG: hypothetical protein JXX28_10570 [Deltaproteobacteria bacterium]|nr:hypothetical protein [Deltaproteobacteria bacterium]
MKILSLVALSLVLQACGQPEASHPAGEEAAQAPLAQDVAPAEVPVAAPAEVALPLVKPADWDAMSYNKAHGAAGAIPSGYMEKINAEGGDTGHLGKHLPYVAKVEGYQVPEGKLALMFGDDSAGNAQHPNAPEGTESYENGHFFDLITVRPSVEGAPDATVTTFNGWPAVGEGATGQYAVLGGGDIAEKGGRNTVYLVDLPDGAKSGDVVRVTGHCRYHGEYVDFITVP